MWIDVSLLNDNTVYYDCGFSLSDSDANSRSIRVCCSNRLCFCTANPSAWHNGAVDLSALLSTSQSRGGAVSAPASSAARTSLHALSKSAASLDIFCLDVVKVNSNDCSAVWQHVRNVGRAVRRSAVRRITVVAFNKTAADSSFYCVVCVSGQLQTGSPLCRVCTSF